MGDYENILYEIDPTNNAICRITLNRPDKYNAINRQMAEELIDAFRKVRNVDSVGVVVLTGAGEKAFCTGGDLDIFPALMEHRSAMHWLAHEGLDVQNAVSECEKVVIGKIKGHCLAGGLELALCCDLLYAKKSVKFGFTEINMGILPGWGGTARLARRIPLMRAKEILFSGRKDYPAGQMYEAGLLTGVFKDEEFEEKFEAVVLNIATKSPIALRIGKEIMDKSAEGSLDIALALERNSIQWLINSPEVKAFFAQYKGGQASLTKAQKDKNIASDEKRRDNTD
ncbi:MAG: enoyl-CoA hydratase/isomerase family protein [Dissulfuribacterales bacterium]